MVAHVIADAASFPDRPSPLADTITRASRVPAAAAYGGILLLSVFAPFERLQPLLRVPGQSVSNLESVLLAAFLAWAVAAIAVRRMPHLRTPLTTPWTVFVAAMGIAAILAPVARTNALHMAGRFAAAFAVFLLTFNAAASRRRAIGAAAAIVATGVVAAAFVTLEFFGRPAVLEWLTAFRPHVITVGPLVRAGGTLQYPTIASMYLEVVFAIGMGLVLVAIDASRRAWGAVLFGGLTIVGYGIAVTFTRAGVASLAGAIVLVLAARVRARGFDAGARTIVALAAAVAAVGLGSRSADAFWLRYTTEGQESWYRASFEPPADVTLRTASAVTIPIAVTNTGRLVWDSHDESPFYLSYHWMALDEDRYVAFEGLRTAFSEPVAPGETVHLAARVRAPRQPGSYRLAWDVVQERKLWFGGEPGAVRSISHATVEGETGAPIDDSTGVDPAVRPNRFVLWSAAARMLREHPFFGIGPDNFRLSYASYAGLRASDPRRHSNNMYIEMFAGGGLVGGAAFLWLVWTAAAICVRLIGASGARTPRDAALHLGLAAAAAAIALHGLVDSFLGFAPTYVLFSLTLGLAAACARGVETRADAHRI